MPFNRFCNVPPENKSTSDTRDESMEFNAISSEKPSYSGIWHINAIIAY